MRLSCNSRLRQYCDRPFFHGKKEYSVEYMDGQFHGILLLSVEKEGCDYTCPVTILPLSGMARPFRAALVGQ